MSDLQVLVGATVPERDITEVIDGLAYSSANPGGFASCNFTVPGKALYRYVNQLRTDARVWVKRGAKTLWEGFIVNDPEAVRFGDSEDVAVECSGNLEVAKRNKGYCKTWRDQDYDVWVQQSNSSSSFESDLEGHIYLSISDDSYAAAGSGVRYWYWIDSGLGGDDIQCIYFDANWSIGSNWDAKVTYATHPYDSWSDSNFLASAEASPVSDFRCPAAGSFAAGTKAVRVSFYCTITGQASADRFIEFEKMRVFGASYSTLYLDDYMIDAAGDIVSTTTGGGSLAYTSTVVARPFTTRAEAIDYYASLYAAPVDWGFWADDTFTVAARATSPAVIDHLIVDASDAGVDWQVERVAEDAAEAVCVMYGIKDDATYPDGTVRTVYRASEPAGADARVHVLDYTQANMTATEAAGVGDQYLDYLGAVQYEGTVTVVGSCKRVDGVPVLASDIRAGMWVECLDQPSHEPVFVSYVDYTRDTDTATLTIGDPRKEFMLPGAGPVRPAVPNIIFKRM